MLYVILEFNILDILFVQLPFLFLKSTDATTGAPTSAVTELTGNAPSNPGMRAIRLHTNAKAAPTSKVAGINMRWSDV